MRCAEQEDRGSGIADRPAKIDPVPCVQLWEWNILCTHTAAEEGRAGKACGNDQRDSLTEPQATSGRRAYKRGGEYDTHQR